MFQQPPKLPKGQVRCQNPDCPMLDTPFEKEEGVVMNGLTFCTTDCRDEFIERQGGESA